MMAPVAAFRPDRKNFACRLLVCCCAVQLLLLHSLLRAQDLSGVSASGWTPTMIEVLKSKAQPGTLEAQAKRGDAGAALSLGYMYRLGYRVGKNSARAVKWFRQSADRGNAEAQLQLAIMYAAGEGVKQDNARMLAWLRKSAEGGYPLAQLQLGILYAKGLTVSQDNEQAALWLGFAAEQNPEMAKIAASIMQNPHVPNKARRSAESAKASVSHPVKSSQALDEVQKKYGKAFSLLKVRAERGDISARYMLGLVYEWIGREYKGMVNPYDREAARWFRAVAEQNSADHPYVPYARHILSQFYYEGRGVQADEMESFLFLSKAAESGFVVSQLVLSNWYGNTRSVSYDPAMAKEWLDKALAQGNYYARRKKIVGEQFVGDKTVSAAKRGDAKAQFLLGRAYKNGLDGFTKSAEQAVIWFNHAAAAGNVMAENEMGLAYYHGSGVRVDYPEAVKWFERAEEKGDAESQRYLGEMLARGQGVARNYARAVALFRASVAQGYTQAEYMLASMYRRGLGVGKDKDGALDLYAKSALKSDRAVKRMLELLQEK
ncbi:MAG: sel1 repeat family protein [Burkholderiaceae bacterium]|jgi:TPR repeat protein|nr:sel1 repeat family protein [Burkholderiaceae bacterium]